MASPFRQVLNWITVRLGYRVYGKINREPPNNLIQELINEDGPTGTYVKPRGVVGLEFVMVFTWKHWFRMLLSGKVQVITLVWTWGDGPVVAGDMVNWCVLPPGIEVQERLKINAE